MSTLEDKISSLYAPKRSSGIQEWFLALSSEEQEITWKALQDPNLKTYTLFGIFREEGLKVSKDTFVPFRKDILDGKIQRSYFDE